ncbi:MAG TPA: hypothetical protein VGE86_00220, partial [Thermoanaerobaculia bacterium]
MKIKTIGSIAAAALLTSAMAIAAPDHGAHDVKGHAGMHGQGGAMHGQAGAGMHGKGAMQGRMAEKLGLSDAQKTQMKEL